jgi:hypothetical protein
MHMQMGHGLACAGPVIDADVVTLWLEFMIYGQLGTIQQGKDVAAFRLCQVEKRANVPLRDQQGVSMRNWIAIPDCNRGAVFVDDPPRRKSAERTPGWKHFAFGLNHMY